MPRIVAALKCGAKDLAQAGQRDHAALKLIAKYRRTRRDDDAGDRHVQSRQGRLHRATMSMILTDRILKDMPSLAGGKMLHPLGAVQRPDDVTAIGLGLDH